MGHSITAVIGPRKVVEQIAAAAGCPKPTDLILELVIAPLGEAQIDRLTSLNPGQGFDGFCYLSAGLELALIAAADGGQFAYVETNYFGGAGSQAAAAYSNGEAILRKAVPVTRNRPQLESPINSSLRALGVRGAPDRDEFDTLGLGKFRTLEALGLGSDG